MYICSCNPFSDKAVTQYLKECGDQKARCGDVYQACSGGQKPNCGRCGPTLKEMVREHNNTVTVNQIKENFPAVEETPDRGNPTPAVSAPKPDEPAL